MQVLCEAQLRNTPANIYGSCHVQKGILIPCLDSAVATGIDTEVL